MHVREAAAVERENGVVELEEPVPEAAEDRAEEVAFAPRTSVGERDPEGRRGCEERREERHRGYRGDSSSPGQRPRARKGHRRQRREHEHSREVA